MIYLLGEAFGMHFVKKHRPGVFEMSTVIPFVFLPLQSWGTYHFQRQC
ncbi:rCG50818 [Rattus norvegicus]|uniref:RCG50818 n=1 Tax=Rattus norvegicus TaxID=10116 RepID=A6KCW9_RAT|nr:rCG50818 [Rattus norvegicus]